MDIKDSAKYSISSLDSVSVTSIRKVSFIGNA